MRAISSPRNQLPGSSRRWPVAWVDLAWAAFSLVNLGAIAIFARWGMVPFHLVWIGLWVGLVLLYAFGVWSIRLVTRQNARLLATQRRFLQDASHQLRTPITIALGHAELLAGELAGRPEARDIQVVVGELDRLRRLGERLLMIAAAEDPDFLRPEPVALGPFLLDVLRKWMPTSERRWQLGALAPLVVSADRERLGLALDALLENAVKYTGTGDEISLSVLAADGGGTARMIVADSGVGIAPAELDSIFERFRSGAQPAGSRGTGLGLALVRAVAHAHGGEVTVRSVPGGGSEFELLLPVLAGAGQTDAPPPEQEAMVEDRWAAR